MKALPELPPPLRPVQTRYVAAGLLSRAFPWPLPAVLAWAGGWAVWQVALSLAWSPLLAWSAGLVTGAAAGLACRGHWRRLLAAGGFPLASLVLGAGMGGGMGPGGLPPLAWGGAAALLLLLYPLGAWRDAPFFPTPSGALDGLGAACAAQTPTSVLDAGCGLGHGLAELRRQFPQAQLHGIERSRVLRWLAALRCPWARVRSGDIWQADWSGHQLVYVFQRPESMARAHAKAMAELPPGGWLASLEFEVPGVQPLQCLRDPAGQGKPVWLYRAGSTEARACR